MTPEPQERRCDVAIVGGGLVGSALAFALAQLPLDVVLVESQEVKRLSQPSFDQRVTALANGSQRILGALGLWRDLAGFAEPIRTIHISERGRFGAARIHAADEGVPALGYTVENAVLGRVLWERLEGAARFECLAPAKVTGLALEPDAAALSTESREGPATLHARLVVAADGVRSSVRTALGIDAHEDDYAQHAVIFNCTTELALGGRAFERFTADGPIAILPLTGGRAAVIWTLPAAEAQRVAALPEDAFRAALQRAFGQRLGRFERIGARATHALARVRSGAPPPARVVLLGDAAMRLHPVAGQGFNLALRDVATLAEVLADAIAATPPDRVSDAGSADNLARYRDWRAQDQQRVSRLTHGLIQLFGESAPGLGFGRGLALMAFDLLPGTKALLARQTMGRAGRLPRLARGVSLVAR